MASNANKDPLGTLIDKLRASFGFGDHPNNNKTLPPKKRFSIWYFLLAMLFLSYAQQFFVASKVETIPYSQFKQSIADGTVGKLIIGPENITGTLKGSTGQAFKTIRVDDPGLAKELDERNISYSEQYDNKFLGSLLSWVLPLGFFYLIWRFAMKKMGPGMGVMSFSKSKAFDAETPWCAKEGNIN